MSQSNDSGLNLDHLEALRKIGILITTQDNRITDQPMFIVQQRRRMYGLDTGYCDNFIWLCSEDEYNEASDEEADALEAEYQDTGRVKDGWQRTGYIDQWEFVTACFTEQGCIDYLKLDGHNLKEPRIYAEGSYRNDEFRAVRNVLIALANQPAPTVPAIGDLNWHKEALAAYEGKLRAVWQGVRDAVEKYSAAPCEGEPFDRLDELLARLAHQPAQEQADETTPSVDHRNTYVLLHGYSAQQEPVAAPQQAAAPGALPERDPSKPAEQQGLFRKFDVRRTDGSDHLGEKHHGCRYYVLDLTHDQHAPAAMRAYGAACASTHPQLAADIRAEFGAPGTPEAPKPPFPINDDEMAALRRFWECATDDEGYDVSKRMMQRLADMGLVQRKSGSYYMSTDFGLYVLGEYTVDGAAQLDGGQEGSGSNG